MPVSAQLLGLKDYASASGYPVIHKHGDKAEREHVAKAILPETMMVGGDTACYLHGHCLVYRNWTRGRLGPRVWDGLPQLPSHWPNSYIEGRDTE